MRDRFSRPIFGPFRQRTRTGVPADHFPKASLMYGDGVTALVADGPTRVVSTADFVFSFNSSDKPQLVDVTAAQGVWWFPDEAAREKFASGLDSWVADWDGKDPAGWTRLSAELAAVGASTDKIDGGVTATVASGPADVPATVEPSGSPLAHLSEVERRRLDGANEITDPAQLSALVASAFDARGGTTAWEKLRERKGVTAAVSADGTVTPGEWHAYLCAEGVRTDDGRELMLGACRYPDLPVSLRLLIEDEGGHWGAVTCGKIDTIESQDVASLRMHYAEGMFGSDPNGQLAELMVEEQTQRFVSIDPRDVTCEYVQVAISVGGMYGDEESCDYDCWLRISDCVIGAATVVSMPALPQAVITPRSVALPDAPIANATAPTGLVDLPEGVAASGAPPAGPRREWFDDPGFHVGDPRLVLQADEKSYACPLTIGDVDPETGRRPVFGHVAWWNCDHTGFPGRSVKPPRSESAYAYYLTGPGVMCSDGQLLPGVGQVTMGCGHAPMTKQIGVRKVALSAQEAIAHYDGGYGAIQVADVRAGQDDFGPWIAGAVKPGVTDDQLADFMALSLSGDWREIAGRLDMVAVLAVPVPGFPIRRALAASGAPEVEANDFHAAYEGERLYALVAAGVVRRMDPAARIAHLERVNADLAGRVERIETRLSAAAASSARARFGL